MTRAFHPGIAALCGLLLAGLLASCGGSGDGAFSGTGSSSSGGGTTGGGTGSGGTTATGTNVATVTVNQGATGNSINTLFVSVTVCAPGSTTNCQTIPNIQVDTGSTGLRILASALTQATLPAQTAPVGGALLECLSFVDGYIWGPVALADVTVGGESASSVPVQVIGSANYPNVPADCISDASTDNNEDTVTSFGANGILGVGPFYYDCDAACVGTALPASYYGCTSSAVTSCTASVAPLTQQVQSVVANFATDNNGVIIDLPTVADPTTGAATLTGSLIFGIDTQSNNASGTQTVLTTDQYAYITIQFNGQTLNQSFLDSGTNGIYFEDSSLPVCTQSALAGLGFYCPTTTQAFTATLLGQNDISSVVDFDIGNDYTMLSTNSTYAVLPELGGQYSDGTPTFDFGLPFFYGRRVAVAMEGITTTAGTGPYFAF